MTEKPDKPKNEERQTGSRARSWKRALGVGFVLLIGAAIMIVSANRDQLSVRSDIHVSEQDEISVVSTLENQPPEILSLTAATDRIKPFDLCEIICEAFDPEGDELTYEWSASAGDIYGEGARIQWGSPISEGLYRISVVVKDGRGGRAEHSLPLKVKANRPPQITRLASDVEWLPEGGSALLRCEATDPDGDHITYEWSAPGGEFFGQGSSVIWLAPEESESYWITVTARDPYGGEASRAVPISVTPVEPPSISAMIVEPKKTSVFKTHGNSWTIFAGGSCTIECVVADGKAPFTYAWRVDAGDLHADGPVATWHAPNKRIGATIVVVVTDIDGSKSSASVLIYVETSACSACG